MNGGLKRLAPPSSNWYEEAMTFAASKLLWFVADPGNVLLILLCAGALLLGTRTRQRLGRRLVGLAALAGLAITVVPLGAWLHVPLENRFPVPARLPDRVDGVVVLGGAVDQFLTVARGQPALRAEAERMTAFAALARRYPEARLVFTGGSGRLVRQGVKETVAARLLFEELGLDVERVLFEDRSRNTYENAVYSYRLAAPQPGETWLLVTSAYHMPRAVGCFRRAGWHVVPYPVDFRTDGTYAYLPSLFFAEALVDLGLAVHEWIGLAAYRLMGRTDRLLPGPAD